MKLAISAIVLVLMSAVAASGQDSSTKPVTGGEVLNVLNQVDTILVPAVQRALAIAEANGADVKASNMDLDHIKDVY
jgi:hypothetical protein